MEINSFYRQLDYNIKIARSKRELSSLKDESRHFRDSIIHNHFISKNIKKSVKKKHLAIEKKIISRSKHLKC